MTRLGKRTEPIFNTHHLVDALIARADHLAKFGGGVVAGLEDARLAFLAGFGVFASCIPVARGKECQMVDTNEAEERQGGGY